MVVSVRRVIDE